MDTNAKPGTKVRFIGRVFKEQVNWGSHTDPFGILFLDHVYTIQRIEVHTWHTKVFLEEFPGKAFNSVWFEEIL